MVTIRVPATTANLGPGFDCLGAALTLYARFTFEKAECLAITGCAPEFSDENNLVYRAFSQALAAFSLPPCGLALHIQSDIPPARGLGSSAACVTAGILGAAALFGAPLSKEELFNLAAQMDGHPDNAAAAVYGGLRAAIMQEGKAHSLPLTLHPSLRFLALVPDFSLSTKEARRVLPDMVSREDAVFNLSHTAYLIKALETGEGSAIRLACMDRLHQPHRFPLIPGAPALAQAALDAGAYACFLSGAGPTLMCVHRDVDFPANMGKILTEGFPRFQALSLMPCPEGATIERTD
jgi:homoserine kinase